jgi:hypothetical protein
MNKFSERYAAAAERFESLYRSLDLATRESCPIVPTGDEIEESDLRVLNECHERRVPGKEVYAILYFGSPGTSALADRRLRKEYVVDRIWQYILL